MSHTRGQLDIFIRPELYFIYSGQGFPNHRGVLAGLMLLSKFINIEDFYRTRSLKLHYAASCFILRTLLVTGQSDRRFFQSAPTISYTPEGSVGGFEDIPFARCTLQKEHSMHQFVHYSCLSLHLSLPHGASSQRSGQVGDSKNTKHKKCALAPVTRYKKGNFLGSVSAPWGRHRISH